MRRVSTLGIDASSIGGTAVSASHTLIDVDITVRAFKPAQPGTLATLHEVLGGKSTISGRAGLT